MERQLIKVAKELNVSLQAIVEHLHGKGFDIESKPIAKVTDVMYDAVVKKFSDSKAEKQKADQLVIGTRPMQNQQPTQQPPAQPRTPSSTITLPPLERKIISLTAKPEEKLVLVEKPATTVVLDRPKVDAPKIDLTPRKEEPKPMVVADSKPEIKADAVAPLKPEVKPTQPSTPRPNNEQRPNNNGGGQRPNNEQRPNNNGGGQRPNNEQRPNNNGGGQRPNNNGGQRPNNEQRPNNNGGQRPNNEQRPNNNGGQRPNNDRRNNDRRNDQRPNNNAPKPVLPPVPVAPKEPESIYVNEQTGEIAPELIRAVAPELRGLNIKGKIDIVKYLEKEKEVSKSIADKKKKTRDQERSDRNRRRGGGGGGGERGANGGDRPLNADGSKPAVDNNPNSEANKRKRKRKKVPTTGTPPVAGAATENRTGGNNQGGGNRSQGNNQGGGNRSQGNNQGGGNRPQGNNQGGGNRGGNNNAPPRRDPNQPTEISQQQIEAKIKETMARLNIGGKNKGQKIRRDKRSKLREREEIRQQEMDTAKLQVAEFISVSDLASLMDISATEIIKTCMGLGVFVSINQRLDAELIEVITSEFGHEVEFISAEEQVSIIDEEPDAPEDLVFRAPVVTIMGHVDHGKTSLLDHVRKTNVASGEAGGITQHIGAYEVKLADGRRITFLDTPGHEAFTAMRARGAKVTDIAVVIIAADDNIMPQTREAISHAQAAGVPIVFAINKIDKPGADPERIKNELAQMNLLVEDWGGKFQSQDISAKKGIGIEELMEKILLEAELLDLKANPNKRASGTVIEASLDKGRGYVSKMLVQAGTMKVGDFMVAGENAGRVKAMFNERGQKIKEAGPSAPVLVLGLSGAPQAGEIFKVMQDESAAKEIATKRSQIVREQSARATKRISLDEIGRRLALGTFKELNLIIKGDVDGSVEALSDSLLKQSHETVQVNVLHKAVGAITEADIMLASASDAIIIGFQVRPSLNARKMAEREGVEIKLYSIIYEAIAEIRSAIEGMLEPTKEEKITSTVEVRAIFTNSKIGTIAGCYVQEGKIERKQFIRIIRDGIVIFPVKEGATATLGSLKRIKDDVKEVRSGFECGLTIDNYNDIKIGDFIESYEIIEVKQKLAAQ
jgi:translation initiation factor IF-2